MTVKRDSLVSICMPVLNARAFLEARLDSIFEQSFQNWELIVVDGYSSDGSWEFLVRRCGEDPRVHLAQAPRAGIYAAINLAVKQAQGDWIYIAPADDTMEPRCLEVLVALAREGPANCIAQCALTMIDAEGAPLPKAKQWPHNAEWHSVFGSWFQTAHERLAPFDGATVMLFGSVITSLTQALFPREAFLRFGGFPTQFGPAGDMAWVGLVGFFHDVVYTPERLATWRIHDAQATAAASVGYYDRQMAISDWMLETLNKCDAGLGNRVRKAGLREYNRFAHRRHEAAEKHSVVHRASTILRMARAVPRFYRHYLTARVRRHQGLGHDATTLARKAMLEQFLKGPADSLLSRWQQAPSNTIRKALVHQ